ncbi:MAG: lipopolysaccharide biosynthesis protein [Deltaproteobacteria bacterium]|nr:lipopolysaccharide biosynthesis protein [Deltaproteobacteria bacterium]MBW1932278.1 lipopolysaccharide biosynthesis protein [Deltaproteobacteria bacterium]MBW1937683.1 lipopolysaccharide biosynthesis protein [Deltaproteobacteria bacterium]MBW1964233.1 lipopolysaccharide biosynthesis protein [Deltaproteobacteria bacterium]MBW2079991.1 lipopolysaccharide biosynthesis protein [Deltaproteobacteria bacterium]
MIQNIERGPQSLKEYTDLLRRRKWQIFIPWLVVFGAITTIAYLLPPVYRSTATILIESQQVPQDLIRTTVTGFAEERIKSITQQILSRKILLNIINDFDLYSEKRGKDPTEEILEDMRDDIFIEMVSAEVPDRRGGRPVTVNVAFTVSYEGRDPQKVMQVTNRLASLFLEHNLRMREGLAETTTELLEQQLEQYRGLTQNMEERIARFKEAHITELPELMNLNLETERQLRRQIDGVDEQMRSLKDRKIYFEGQLATVSMDSPLLDVSGQYIMDPRERLRALKSQAITLEATLSSKHPDVTKVRKEISELEKEIGTPDKRLEMKEALRLKEQEFKELKTSATEKHPDVLKLKKEIEKLKENFKDYEDKGKEGFDFDQAQPTNPAYISLQTQIKVAEMDLKGLKDKRQQLEESWQDYVKRLEKMPQVELEYRELIRDYDAEQKKYAETMAKLMEAHQGQSMEQLQAGEKFTIIDPPQLPEIPAKPKRVAISLIGFILGIATGVGVGALMEFADSTIRSPKDIRRITGHPVLASIPDVAEVQKKRGRHK